MGLWTNALGLVTRRMPSPTLFAALTAVERGAALRALPVVERALLFENFSDCGQWGDKGPSSTYHSGDARGEGFNRGDWTVGPGTFVPPRMERCLAGPLPCPSNGTVPLSTWCLSMVNDDPNSNLDPSGLVFRFPTHVRPRLAAFRCKPVAHRVHRCGGVFALAEGLGNDKGPESPAIFVHFTRDPEGRFVNVLLE